MYTDITPPCIRHARDVYTAVTRPCTGRPRPCRRPLCGRVRAVYTAVYTPCNVSCARYTAAVNTSSPAKTVRIRPYNGRAVYMVRTRPCMGRAHGLSTPHVYMIARPVYATRVHDCIRAVCTYVFGRVHGAYTALYTGRVHGHLRAVHTALYTTGIQPRTRVYVYKGRVHGRVRAIYTAENSRLHGRTRPCNVSSIRSCTGCIGSCTWQCTGRVHGRFRPCTLAVYTAVFGRLHSAYTAV